MILLVHMIFGAAIGSFVKNIPLAIVLAFLSHYFLDLFPHNEYSIDKIKNREWNRALPEFSKVFLDALLGFLLIFALSKNNLLIYICAFSAILPDGFTMLNSYISNKPLKLHQEFHNEKVHFLKHKKILKPWRAFIQTIIIVISIILLRT